MTPDHFLLIADPLPEPMLLVSGDGQIRAANSAAGSQFGVPAREIPGRPLGEFIADPPDEIRHYLRLCRRSRSVVLGGLVLRSRNGGIACRAEGAAIPAQGDNGDALVLLRLSRKEQAAAQFTAMNERIEQLAREVHQRRRAEEAARRQEEQLRVTLHSIGDAVIATDPQSRVVLLNPVAEALTGWKLEEAKGRPLDEVFRIVNEATRREVENPAERALREGVVVGLANHTILIARDGSEHPIDDSAAPIRDEHGAILGSVLVFRDIADRRRVERNRNIRLAVTQVLNEAETVPEAAHGVLRALCANLKWDVGFLWLVDESGAALACAASENCSGDPPGEFQRASHRRTFARGEGLPGRVWESGKPVWLLDVTQDLNFPRAAAAIQEGLHSAVGCPLLVGERVLGVIEFFTQQIREPEDELLEMLGTIAGAAGQFLQRRLAEERLREQTATAETLYRIGRLLAQELDLHKLVQMVTDEGTRLCGAQSGAFYYNAINQRGEVYTLYTLSGASPEAFADFLMPRNTEIFSPTFRGEGVVRLDDVTQDPRYGGNAPYHALPEGHLPVKSYLAAPVVSRGGEVLGGLFFGHAEAGVFTDYHERLITGIAGQAAVAIDNARLYQRTQAAAERLRASEERFRGLMEQSPFSIQLFSPDGRTIQVNRAWEELWGLTLEQIEGYNILQDRQLEAKGILPLIQEAFAGEPRFIPAIEYDPNETLPGKTRHADPVRWVSAVAYPLKDDAGKVREVVLVHDDITARRRAEAALRESEEKLRLMADTIPHLAWMANPDGHIFWYNRRWYEYTGTTANDMQGWGWQSVHDPQVLPEVLQRWKNSIATGEPFDMVFPLKGADGQFRPFLTRVNPLKNDEGRVLYWFGTNTDVTEQRQAREALARSEERFRQLADAMPQIVWTARPDGQIDYLNRRWSEFTGLPDNVGNEAWEPLLHPEEAVEAHRRWEASARTGDPFSIELRLLDRQQTYRWHLIRSVAVRDASGAVARWFGTATDIHEQKRAEQTARFLANASAALATLVDFESTLQKVASLAVPYFADWAAVDVLEPEGSLRRVAVAHVDPDKVQLAQEVHSRFPTDPQSPTGVWKILRTGQAELVGEIDDELLSRAVHNEELLGVIRELGLKSYLGIPLTVRGKTIGALTFIASESGHRYDELDLAVAQDLASRAAIAIENSQLYRELRDADRRKDEFLAILAHELRNPLAPIRNGLEVLRLSGVDGPLATEARSMMERQLAQMVRLVDDLLDVSRITRNKLELRKTRVGLAEVVHDAIETSRPLIDQAGHAFSVTLPRTPVTLEADPVRLAQVFSNLLNNSAKYTEPGGEIRLIAEANGGEVVVRVRDSGLGIPPEAIPRLFQMFSQIDRNLERAQGGLGIGLTLVKRLVEMHGGAVDVFSEGPGSGSEFVVRLPRADERQSGDAAHVAEDNAASAAPVRRILVVDDNRDSALSLGAMLQIMGNEIRTAHDGLAAVEAAEQFRPDMILLDIGLPKLNGYDACRLIREKAWSRGVMLVALTGWGQDEDRRRSQDAGFDYHLVKPVDMAALRQLLGSPLVHGD